MFGNAGREHMERYGSEPDHYAWIGWKNHKHSVNNPYAQFQDEYSLEDIKAAKMIHEPLTKLQCSPTSDGSGCAIVASERFVDEHDLWDQAVEIAGQAMVTDMPSTFEERSSIKIVGYDMSKKAAEQAYEEAGVGAEDVDVIELHDCFSANELITYEALGLAEEGEGHKLVETEDTTYGGRWVVNPSGGLISKGHPLGATGLAQCSELTWQLRGDGRQAPGRGREGRPPAQHRPGRRGRRVGLQARGLRTLLAVVAESEPVEQAQPRAAPALRRSAAPGARRVAWITAQRSGSGGKGSGRVRTSRERVASVRGRRAGRARRGRRSGSRRCRGPCGRLHMRLGLPWARP